MRLGSPAPASGQREGDRLRVAVLVPCYNEALTIEAVVVGFRDALPHADIYVYDNNSKDGTAEAARAGRGHRPHGAAAG